MFSILPTLPKQTDDMDAERYSRQTMLAQIGEDGQRRLADARVAVIGLGGLGSVVSTYLAGAGVGHLVLADPDVVGLSNLQRQVLYSECEIGLPKTVCAARRLKALNSTMEISLFPDGLTEKNAAEVLDGCDLLVDCTDNYATRYLIDDCCALAGVPWVYGSLGEFCGHVSVMNYRRGRRYVDLFPDREELLSFPVTTKGVLGAVPGVIGAMQACEAVKVLACFGEPLDGRLFTIDTLTFETNIIDF